MTRETELRHSAFWYDLDKSRMGDTKLPDEIALLGEVWRDEIASKLDDLQRHAPNEFMVRLVALPTTIEPQGLFRKSREACAHLTKHLWKIANALYLAHGKEHEGLDKALRGMPKEGSKKNTLGMHHEVLRKFSAWIEGLEKMSLGMQLSPGMQPLLRVLNKNLPPACSAFIIRTALLKDAHETFGIPLRRELLQRYITRNDKGTHPKTTRLHQFLLPVLELRNADAHDRSASEGSAAVASAGSGLDPNQEWCATVNRMLAPALRELFTWEPLVTALRYYQVAEVQAVPATVAADVEIPIHWVKAASKPPYSVMTMASGDLPPGIKPGTKVLVGAKKHRSVTVFLADWKSFPLSIRSVEDYKKEYKKEYKDQFGLALFDDGIINKQENEALDALSKKRELTESDITSAQQAVWNVYEGLCAWVRGETARDAQGGGEERDDTLPETLRDQLGKFTRDSGDGKSGETALTASEWRARVKKFWETQQSKIMALLNDSEIGLLQEKEIAKQARLPEVVVQRALKRLERTEQVSQLKKTYWQMCTGEEARRLSEIFVSLRNALRKHPPRGSIPTGFWQLMRFSVDFVPRGTTNDPKFVQLTSFAENLIDEFGNSPEEDPEEDAEHAGTRPSSDPGSGAGGNEGNAPEAPPSGRPRRTRRPPVEIDIDGCRYTVRGITRLIKEDLDQAGIWKKVADQLRAEEGFKIGRTRLLFSRDGKHLPKKGQEEGTAFSYPIEIELDGGELIYFEAGLPKEEGAFYIQQFLSNCGISAEIVAANAADPSFEDTADDASDPNATADQQADETIEVSLDYSGGQEADDGTRGVEHKEIAASSIANLAEQVLTFLWERSPEQLLDLIPRQLDRTRYFIHTAPFFAGGDPFKHPYRVDAPMSEEGGDHEVGILYVETDVSKQDAIDNLSSLCGEFHFDLSTEGDEDEDDEQSGVSSEGDDSGDAGAAPSTDEQPRAGRTTVSIELPDNATVSTVSGKTVRQLFTRTMEQLARDGVLRYIDNQGYKIPSTSNRGRTATRYLVAGEPVHENGRSFTTVMQYEHDGTIWYLELNLTRKVALKAMKALIKKVYDRRDGYAPSGLDDSANAPAGEV